MEKLLFTNVMLGNLKSQLEFGLGLMQEENEDDIDRKLTIKFEDTSAFWYIDDELLGSTDIENMVEFEDGLNQIMKHLEKVD